MQHILDTVLSTLQDMRLASSGALLPNDATREASQSLGCSKMPDSWIHISWAASSVTAWITVAFQSLQRVLHVLMWAYIHVDRTGIMLYMYSHLRE